MPAWFKNTAVFSANWQPSAMSAKAAFSSALPLSKAVATSGPERSDPKPLLWLFPNRSSNGLATPSPTNANSTNWSNKCKPFHTRSSLIPFLESSAANA